MKLPVSPPSTRHCRPEVNRRLDRQNWRLRISPRRYPSRAVEAVASTARFSLRPPPRPPSAAPTHVPLRSPPGYGTYKTPITLHGQQEPLAAINDRAGLSIVCVENVVQALLTSAQETDTAVADDLRPDNRHGTTHPGPDRQATPKILTAARSEQCDATGLRFGDWCPKIGV